MSAKLPGAGVALAAIGLSHFAKPQVFEKITAPAFPENTRRHVYVNGTIETALGAALVAPQTRKFALAGLVGYVGYLIFGAARSRRRP
ncbi:hypothetical protein [Mycolicibacterium sp.]|uniref:hypothetical protein n=1 Tax=Mycolicibacterium sp. TaxID=2320850 RepID=UPI0028AAD476|nr:hypothetical protein [Mycolicibacterium sp.]